MTTVRDTSLSLADRKPMLTTVGMECENADSPASCDSVVREVPKGNARNRKVLLLCVRKDLTQPCFWGFLSFKK